MFQTSAQRYIRQTIHFNEEFMKCFKITALVLAAALASIAVGVQVLALFCLYVVAFRGETICPFYPEIDTRFAPGFSKAGFEKIECGMPENKVVDLIGPPLWIKPQAARTSHEEWGYSGDGALGRWGDKAWFYYGVVSDSGHVIEKHVRIYYGAPSKARYN